MIVPLFLGILDDKGGVAAIVLLWQIRPKVKADIRPGPDFMEKYPDIPYSLRYSRKARRINLRVLPGKGLEVVLPQGLDPAVVPQVLTRHEKWIRRRMAEMQTAPAEECRFPQTVALWGGSEELVLQSGPASVSPHPMRPGVIERPLPLPAYLRPEENADRAFNWLRRRVRLEAATRLPEELERVSQALGLPYSGVTVRMQKTRWGSCSFKKKLNLNAALIFLPLPLVRYICVHELCHTIEMNHSEAFWKLVFRFDPDGLEHDRAMRKARRFVPVWFSA